MMPTLQAFIDELFALQEKVRLQEAEIAVLRGMNDASMRRIEPHSEVVVFGRTIKQLAKDLDRLDRFARAAKEPT